MTKISILQNKYFFDKDLIEYMKTNNLEFIIQGQQVCKFIEHKKTNSLDYWIRENYARNRDTKQADNHVIKQLIETGNFKEGKFLCSNTNRVCKGIRLI